LTLYGKKLRILDLMDACLACSRPFPSIPHMINYYTINRLPIKGAEHVSLRTPVCEQLL